MLFFQHYLKGFATERGWGRLGGLMGVKKIWPVGFAMGSGVLLALSYAPYDVAVMVWLGLVPLLVALWAGGGERRRGWYGFRIGYLAGAVFWFLNLKWIAEVGVMGLIAVALFLALYFAVWGAFVAGVGNPWRERGEGGTMEESGIEAKIWARTRAKGSKRGRSLEESRRTLKFALMCACWWCGLEWVRGWFLTGFGWNGLGVAFHDQPILAQGAELVGVTGLSFLPVFVMAVVVQVGRGLHREVSSGKLRAHWDFGAAMALLTVCFIYGIWKLHGAREEESIPLNVLLVQLNIPQEAARRVWEPEEIHRGFEEETLGALEALEERNAERVRRAAEEGQREPVVLDVPDWVVWPEASLSDALFFAEGGEQGIGRATQSTLETVRPAGAFTLLFGLNEVEGDLSAEGFFTLKEGGKHYNSLLALPAGANLFETYRKQHLVLFGETIPDVKLLRWLWQQSAGTEYLGSLDAGEGGEPMTLPLAKAPDGEIALIPTICFEDTVPRKMRKYVKGGGQVIVNVTNDGWFKESEGAAQHFANAKFRSIEFRRPTVRCANTGVSAVVGVNGTVLDKRKNEQRKLVDGTGNHLTRGWLYATAYVPVDGPLTLYARFGDWFAVLGFGVGLACWVVRGRGGNPGTRNADGARGGGDSGEEETGAGA